MKPKVVDGPREAVEQDITLFDTALAYGNGGEAAKGRRRPEMLAMLEGHEWGKNSYPD